MNIILVGYGNVGKEIHKVLSENNQTINIIVRKDGIYDSKNNKLDELTRFSNFVDSNSSVFISTPSIGKGELSVPYYLNSLENGAKIITCEKAFLAYNWNVIEKYKDNIKYSATVGGNSGILDAISKYKNDIVEIKAVVNGTLNYIGEKLAEDLSRESIFKKVQEKGYAEPGSNDFSDVIENELRDVRYKTTILANHSKFYGKVTKPEDFLVNKYQKDLRCSVLLTKTKMDAGFIQTDDISWLPKGVNNVLYINNEKIIEGAGAGNRATAERMFRDYNQLNLLSNTPIVSL